MSSLDKCQLGARPIFLAAISLFTCGIYHIYSTFFPCFFSDLSKPISLNYPDNYLIIYIDNLLILSTKSLINKALECFLQDI